MFFFIVRQMRFHVGNELPRIPACYPNFFPYRSSNEYYQTVIRYGKMNIIKNRNPILASGFHTKKIAIILDESVVKLLGIRVDG